MSRTMPLDIELEIIKRLPVKSLIRFISVCKAWKSFIKCSEFVAGYRVLPAQPHHLLIKYEVPDWQNREIKVIYFVDDGNDTLTIPQQKFVPTVPPLVHQYRIIRSSCGLLCLVGLFREPDNSITKSVVLWNPLIRKSIAVALPNVVRWPFKYVIGFGVCPYTKDLKLVKITYIDAHWNLESISCIPCQVMVFTLSSREWTAACSNQLPRKSIAFEDCSQTVIGHQFIYWLACDWIFSEGYEFRYLIMSFDLNTEEFIEIDLPDSLAYASESDLFISTLRESPVLLHYNLETRTKQVCDVWKMEHGDPKLFTKLFTINAPDASVSQTLGFRKNGEPIIEMQGYHKDFETPCSLVVYEPYSKDIMDLGIHGRQYSFSVYSYPESLLLLDHDDDSHIVRREDVKR